MAKTETNGGIKYTYHDHEAKWKCLVKSYIYKFPMTSSAKIVDKNKKAIELVVGTTYTSSYKTTIKGQQDLAWYYIPKLKGWIPWKLKDKQIVRRSGPIIYCELEKKTADPPKKEDDEVNDEPAPSIYDLHQKNIGEFNSYMKSQIMTKADGRKWSTQFDRLQFANPYHAIPNTREYLFFTKPDLHIFRPGTNTLNLELGNDAFWLEMMAKYKNVVMNLQSSAGKGDTNSMPFMPLLSNAVVSSIDLPGVTGETMDTPQTIYGTSLQYRMGSLKSDESFDFSLEFSDSPSLEIYHLFKMYDSYATLKALGVVSPPMYKDAINSMNRYTVDRILHDQIGIYKIITSDDMETILYYAYYCGCFPKTTARDTFKDMETGIQRYSIDWHAQFVEDMNPLILVDFTELCKKHINEKSDTQVPLWHDKKGHIDGNWLSCPYIYLATDSNSSTGYSYKLRWFKKKK